MRISMSEQASKDRRELVEEYARYDHEAVRLGSPEPQRGWAYPDSNKIYRAERERLAGLDRVRAEADKLLAERADSAQAQAAIITYGHVGETANRLQTAAYNVDMAEKSLNQAENRYKELQTTYERYKQAYLTARAEMILTFHREDQQ